VSLHLHLNIGVSLFKFLLTWEKGTIKLSASNTTSFVFPVPVTPEEGEELVHAAIPVNKLASRQISTSLFTFFLLLS